MKYFQMKWVVPVILLAAVYFGDQIRLGRPDHKFRLTVQVVTPDGVKSASGVLSVRPNRGYGGSGSGSSAPQTSGDALFIDLGSGKNIVALLAGSDGDFEAVNFIALRTLNSGGKRIQFRDVKNFAEAPPMQIPDELLPGLVTFGNPANPGSARRVDAADLQSELGEGYRLQGASLAIVANGFWPLDFGRFLGEPVTRSIASRLPWLRTPNGASEALKAAGIQVSDGFTAEAAFAR